MPKKLDSYTSSPAWNSPENQIFHDIDERLNELEDKVFKTAKKPDATRAEKMVLMKEIGILDYLFTLNVSQKKIAQLLSVLINSSAANIEADLSDRHNPESYLKTESNYKFIIELFQELKLKKYQLNCEKVLDEIESQKT